MEQGCALWYCFDDAFAKACEIEKATGAVFLHPFDDEYVITGQGTIGLEILEDAADLDAVSVPIGGRNPCWNSNCC